MLNIGIIGLGSIAAKMAETLWKMEEVNCYAVASRTTQKALEFAKKWHFEKAYGSYEELFLDKKVDLIYIATPHSNHFEYAKEALMHDHHVLVEKAFTINVLEAQELIQIANEKQLLLAEAIWTRYMPSRKIILDMLPKIGKKHSVTVNLAYNLQKIERLNSLELAGGALLDLGVYGLNFALMFLDGNVEKVSADALISDDGVDLMNNICLTFDSQQMAVIHTSMLTNANRLGLICGEDGYLEVQNINNCEEVRLYNNDHQLIETKKMPAQISGYEYEILACIKAIEQKKIACEEMPHEEILLVMMLMDEIRKKWNMKFPQED